MKIAIFDYSREELHYISQPIKHTKIPDLKFISIDCYTCSEKLIKKVEEYDIFILDWLIDHQTGLGLLRVIREKSNKNPSVIFLSNNNNEKDISTALLAGADDYMVKPYRALELCARIFSAVRHKIAHNTSVTLRKSTIKDFTFFEHSLEIMRGNILIKLTLREFKIIQFLFLNLGKQISREVLYNLFWESKTNCTSRSLDTHIYRIRNQLDLTLENGWQLNTVYGFGYCLEHIDKQRISAIKNNKQ